MNSGLSPERSAEAVGDSNQPTPLRIMVMYADSVTRARALRVHDNLTDESSDDFDIRFTWWKFDFLKHPEMLEEAIDEALKADAIIFSVHSANDLPAEVKSWIAAWKDKREHRGSALVAVYGDTQRFPKLESNVHAQLHSLATESGMEFFPHVLPLSAEAPCCLVDASDKARSISTLLEEILTEKPSIPRWGINE